MSFNVCVGKAVQFYPDGDKRNPAAALVTKVHEEGMVNLEVFYGGFSEQRAAVRHTSDSVLAANIELRTRTGCWDHLPVEKEVQVIDAPAKKLPEPNRK